jgi:hypothetical protein
LIVQLVASEPALAALGKVLDVGRSNKEHWAQALADKLLETEIDEAIQSVYQAWDGLGPRSRAEDRAVLQEVMDRILPVVYDEGVIDCARTRRSMPEAVLLELPAGIETVAEVIMAGVHGRPARFKPLRDRDRFPEGAEALSEPPESGFDSDGSAFEDNVHAHLCNKLLAGDESDFDAFMVGTFVKRAPAHRADGVKEPDLIGMAADELEDRVKYDKRRYYFILKLPAATDAPPPWMVAVKNLKSRYPQLDFIILGHASDGSIIRQERRRFGVLRRILPGVSESKP